MLDPITGLRVPSGRQLWGPQPTPTPNEGAAAVYSLIQHEHQHQTLVATATPRGFTTTPTTTTYPCGTAALLASVHPQKDVLTSNYLPPTLKPKLAKKRTWDEVVKVEPASAKSPCSCPDAKKFETTSSRTSLSLMKKESNTPCQVAEVTTSVATRVKQELMSDTLTSGSVSSGIPVGIAVARQRNLDSGRNRAGETPPPSHVSQPTILHPPPLLVAGCDDRSMWSMHHATPHWQYPPMEPSIPVGFQLVRDPMTGQLLLLPPTNVGVMLPCDMTSAAKTTHVSNSAQPLLASNPGLTLIQQLSTLANPTQFSTGSLLIQHISGSNSQHVPHTLLPHQSTGSVLISTQQLNTEPPQLINTASAATQHTQHSATMMLGNPAMQAATSTPQPLPVVSQLTTTEHHESVTTSTSTTLMTQTESQLVFDHQQQQPQQLQQQQQQQQQTIEQQNQQQQSMISQQQQQSQQQPLNHNTLSISTTTTTTTVQQESMAVSAANAELPAAPQQQQQPAAADDVTTVAVAPLQQQSIVATVAPVLLQDQTHFAASQVDDDDDDDDAAEQSDQMPGAVEKKSQATSPVSCLNEDFVESEQEAAGTASDSEANASDESQDAAMIANDATFQDAGNQTESLSQDAVVALSHEQIALDTPSTSETSNVSPVDDTMQLNGLELLSYSIEKFATRSDLSVANQTSVENEFAIVKTEKEMVTGGDKEVVVADEEIATAIKEEAHSDIAIVETPEIAESTEIQLAVKKEPDDAEGSSASSSSSSVRQNKFHGLSLLLCAVAHQREKEGEKFESFTSTQDQTVLSNKRMTKFTKPSKEYSNGVPPTCTTMTSHISYRPTGTDRPHAFYTASTACDPAEQTMRTQLAELRKLYREKQRELSKLSNSSCAHASSSPSSQRSPGRRGPGRPRKHSTGKTSSTERNDKEKSLERLRSLSPRVRESELSPPVLEPSWSALPHASDSRIPPVLTQQPSSNHVTLTKLTEAARVMSDGLVSHQQESSDERDQACKYPPPLSPAEASACCSSPLLQSPSVITSSSSSYSSSQKRKVGRPKKRGLDEDGVPHHNHHDDAKKSRCSKNALVGLLLGPSAKNRIPALSSTQHEADTKPHKIRPKLKAEVKMKLWSEEEDGMEWTNISDESKMSSPLHMKFAHRRASVPPVPESSSSASVVPQTAQQTNAPTKFSSSGMRRIMKSKSLPGPNLQAKANKHLTKEKQAAAPVMHKRRSIPPTPSFSSVKPSEIAPICLATFAELETVNCRLSTDSLDRLPCRVLVAKGGLFYAGELSEIQAPDLYGITLDGERAHRPHIYTQEEVLNEIFQEVKVSLAPRQGTRLCAFWSQQYRCLYPGTVGVSQYAPHAEQYARFVSVEFDDGDDGRIALDDLRLLPRDYPVVQYDPNPLLTLGKRKRRISTASSDNSTKTNLTTEPTLEGSEGSQERYDIDTIIEEDELRTREDHDEDEDEEEDFDDHDHHEADEDNENDEQHSSEMENTDKEEERECMMGQDVECREKQENGEHENKLLKEEEKLDCNEVGEGNFKNTEDSNQTNERDDTNMQSGGHILTEEEKERKRLKKKRREKHRMEMEGGGEGSGGEGKKRRKKCSGDCSKAHKHKKHGKHKHHRHHKRRHSAVDESETNKEEGDENRTPPQASERNDRPIERPLSTKPLQADSGNNKDATTPARKQHRDRQNSVEGKSKMAAFLPAKQLWQWLGRGYKRPGAKGRCRKEFYKSIHRENETISVGDCAVFLSTGRPDRPFIGRIESMWSSWTHNMVVKVRWFYHPEETAGCPDKLAYPGALFESPHNDENDVQTISHKCEVLPLGSYKEWLSRDPNRVETIYEYNDIYFLAGYYDPTTLNLTFEPGVI